MIMMRIKEKPGHGLKPDGFGQPVQRGKNRGAKRKSNKQILYGEEYPKNRQGKGNKGGGVFIQKKKKKKKKKKKRHEE